MLFLALSLSTIPVAAETIPLKLVTGSDYAPYVDEQLPGGGPLLQLIKQAFAKSGIDVEVSVEPWRRGYEGLLAHRFDATFPYVRTEQRMREMLFSDAITAVRQRLIVASGNEQAAMASGWMKNKRVCAAVGFALPPWMDLLIRQGDVSRITPNQQRSCLAMIASARADFMVEDERIALTRKADGFGQGKLATVPGPVVSETSLHLIVAKDNPDAQQILDRFNQGLAQLRAEGAIPDILVPKPPS